MITLPAAHPCTPCVPAAQPHATSTHRSRCTQETLLLVLETIRWLMVRLVHSSYFPEVSERRAPSGPEGLHSPDPLASQLRRGVAGLDSLVLLPVLVCDTTTGAFKSCWSSGHAAKGQSSARTSMFSQRTRRHRRAPLRLVSPCLRRRKQMPRAHDHPARGSSVYAVRPRRPNPHFKYTPLALHPGNATTRSRSHLLADGACSARSFVLFPRTRSTACALRPRVAAFAPPTCLPALARCRGPVLVAHAAACPGLRHEHRRVQIAPEQRSRSSGPVERSLPVRRILS